LVSNSSPASDCRIAIILPAYNEAQTIAATMQAFHTAAPKAEIWVINNRSTDSTQSIAETTLRELGCGGGILSEDRKGKGNAVRRAFLEIDADVYVMADADLTYPAGRIDDLIKPIREGKADMVVGDRISSGHYSAENPRPLHGFGNRVVRDLVNYLFGASLKDIMSGYRTFSRRFVKNYPILVEGFEIETDMTLHALDKRFRIVEMPIEYKDRPAGSFSKLNTFTDGMRVLFVIAQIVRYYRPMIFFGFLALLFAAAGLVAAIPVFSDWLEFGYIYHVPLAILATGAELVAIVLMAVGLILDSVVQQGKREFERTLLDARSPRPALVSAERFAPNRLERP
jgi:glycosyltransferase involved in cell wall biosynthesis